MAAERIVSVEYIGEIETMDLEVDNDTHTFLANGIETSNSHAVGYGKLSFVTAFAKAHFPEYFYAAYLEGADNKQDPLEERYKIVQDAKRVDIKIDKPDLDKSKTFFYSPTKGKVLFGLNSVKSVGDSAIKKIRTFYSGETSWLQLLVKCLNNLNIRAAQNIIRAGIIENGMTRRRQLHELSILRELTKGQMVFIRENVDNYINLRDLLVALNKPQKLGGGLTRATKRKRLIV